MVIDEDEDLLEDQPILGLVKWWRWRSLPTCLRHLLSWAITFHCKAQTSLFVSLYKMMVSQQIEHTLHGCIISPILIIKTSKVVLKGWGVFVIFIFRFLGLPCLAHHASLL